MTTRAQRLAAALALAMAVPAAALAGDPLDTLGIERRDLEDSLLTLLARGEVWAPAPRKTFQSLTGAQKASLVKGLGEVAKAWMGTEDFRARWAQERQAVSPKEPVPARDAERLAAEERAQFEQAVRQAEQAIAALPPGQQGPPLQALKAAREQMARAAPSADDVRQREEARYQREKEEYERRALPQDPKECLRMRLKSLLEATDKVDYKAKLVDEGGVKRFAATEQEARPAEWKLCFRVGKEACEAARSFARGWLAQIK